MTRESVPTDDHDHEWLYRGGMVYKRICNRCYFTQIWYSGRFEWTDL